MWDCGVHVIKHIQTFENDDPIKAFSLFNSAQIRQKITIDLV